MAGVAGAALYLASTARTVQSLGDSGELCAAVHNLGVPHPPGFPAYMIVAVAFSRLSPFGTTFDLALMAVLAGGAALAVLCLMLLRLGIPPLAALVTAVLWAVLPRTWGLHTAQEVFSLAHLAAACVLALAIAVLRGRAGLVWLGLAFGAGVMVHPIVVLTAPLALAATLAPAPAPLHRRAARLAAGTGLGALTCLYLPLASAWGGLPRWGHIDSLASLVHHLARAEYGSLDLAIGARESAAAAPSWYAEHLARDGLGLPALLLAAGLLFLARDLWPRSGAQDATGAGTPDPAGRRFLIATAIAFAIAVLLFLSRFRVPGTAWWRVIAGRFFPLVDLLALPLWAYGLHRGLGALQSAWPRLRHLARAATVTWVALVLAAAAPAAVHAGRDLVRAYADDLLAAAEPGAVLIGQSDLAANAIWEAQLVRGLRPDVTFVAAGMLPMPWYARQVEAALDGYRHPERMKGIRLLLRHVLSAGRAAYLSDGLAPALAREFRLVPEGVAWRVLPAASPLPPPAEVEARALRHLGGRAGPSLPAWMESGAIDETILEHYRSLWGQLAAVFAAAGDPEGARRCAARARTVGGPQGVDSMR